MILNKFGFTYTLLVSVRAHTVYRVELSLCAEPPHLPGGLWGQDLGQVQADSLVWPIQSLA